MAKQNINVGTTANDKKGDSLRAAFVKVNANFTELYAALGLTDVTLNLGAFTFTGSTMSTDDSTNIVIDKPITVNGEITVDGDIVPKTNLGASLGTPTKQFKSLYVSNNTIFIGGFPISVDGSGNLVVNNGAGGGEFSNLTVANTFEVEGTLEITKNNREGTVALSVTSSFDTGRLGAGQLVFEGNHPTYGIIPSNDDSYSLGNPAFGWSTVYTHAIDFANGTQQNSAGVEIYDANTSSPYVVFPVITGGDQLQIVGAEVSTIAGNLALTSVADANIISNGSGAIPGGSKTWTFGADGSVTIPGDIRSEGNINIEINLSDSTLRRWQFGEDGELTLPEDAVVKTTSGHLTIKGQNNVYIDSATNGQIEIGRSSGVGAVVLGSKSRGTNVVVDDLVVANGVYEFFSSLADATGVVTHNCANGHLFYHTSPDANWTVNLTNLLDTWNRATSVTLIIAQGATGYIPNAVQIAGVAQTLNWQGNVTPTPSTNRTDVVTFSIINNSGTYIVLGQLTGF